MHRGRVARALRGLLLPPAALASCERGGTLPPAGSAAYAEAVSAFYTGVAAVQVGENGIAEAAFRRVTELAEGEPAAWANLGLVALQRQAVEEAAARLGRALALAPESAQLELVAALIHREGGRLDSAAAHLRRAIELDPQNLKALYLLAQIREQTSGPAGSREARELIGRILAADPDNLVALLEQARLAAAQQDADAVREALGRVERRVGGLPFAPALGAVRRALAAADFRGAGVEISFLQTDLQALPAYRDDQDALLTAPGGTDALLTRFLRLPAATARPAPPDTGLEFAAESLSIGTGPVSWVRALWLSDELPLVLVAGDARTVWISPDPAATQTIPFPGGAAAVAALDYDYDFRADVALAGPGGLRLLRQTDAGRFTDVTAAAIPAAAARRASAGVWAADLDMEGDLDLVVGSRDGAPLVLWNRGDGRFLAGAAFDGVTRVRDFVWADLDADGDPDAALLDAEGRLQVYLNGRSRVPQFQRHAMPDTLPVTQAIASADWDGDATLDLVVLAADGTLARLALNETGWTATPLGRWAGFSPGPAGATRLFAADFDNNGDVDLLGAAPTRAQVWLKADGRLEPHRELAFRITDVADLSGEGRLDLFGVSRDGRPRWFANRGVKDYFSAVIRPRAAEATGDRRINPFGVGGEIEVRAGLLYQKQAIRGPVVHFGLGDHPVVEVARIIWPNGSVQAEFNLAATNETVLTRQRLKGSCPWVFAFDGRRMRFVTDFLWRTALGLRINARGDAAVIHSEDWIRIPGDQLAPRNGTYHVRITGELWETHFFDHVALLVVDHPAGTEAWVDERFTLPAPEPRVTLTGALGAVAGAWDHRGRDVTALIRDLDERFLDTFTLGPYQGIAEEHWVEVALGPAVPTEGPLWLVASGWVYPTDASINVAVSQRGGPFPGGLQLEVADGTGGWVVAQSDLGFPAGKTKTMLVDLRGAFPPGAPRRLRLRTNLEIYWDRIAWAVGRPEAPVTMHRVLPAVAELRYRGFSAVRQAGRRAPELPDYETLAAVAPRWRDLVGYYTRFGDVGPLIQATDDRYVIMNAGDELALQFAAPPPPRSGWTRDFVLVGDGWVKDGDYNTGFSTTVLPLPYHGMTDYGRPPGRLEDDPAYRLHPDDWKTFHTRYVTARTFHRALTVSRAR